jgi:glycosyltransferase involved in cell wall biosynthesis
MKSPPIIRPYPDIPGRPLWSVMIPVYNSSHLLRSTLESILQQDPGQHQMQIMVVDDASTDANLEVMVQEIGRGRVMYYRQPRNVGSLKNFETCINMSQGLLVHILHGDDRVRVGYYERVASLFRQFPEIGAAFCRYDTIDENGKVLWTHTPEMEKDGVLDNWLLKIASKQRLQFCTITVKREVYEKLGGYYGVNYGEDWEMWARIAAHYKVGYTPEILAEYRMHTDSISSASFGNAHNIRDIRWVINTIQKLVPQEQRKQVYRAASKHYAHYALTIANLIWHRTQNKKSTHLQICEALKMHTDATMLINAAKIYTKMMIGRV